MESIYILLLESDKYYVGITKDISKRLTQHFSGLGSAWTSMYKPIKIIETIKDCDVFDEDKYTKKYMHKYGIDNVRGGSYSTIELNSETKKMLQIEFNTIDKKCFLCERIGHFTKDCIMNDISKVNEKLARIDERYSIIKKQLSIYQQLETLTQELKMKVKLHTKELNIITLVKEFINDSNNYIYGTIHKRSEKRPGCTPHAHNGKIWFIPDCRSASHEEECKFISPCGLFRCHCKFVSQTSRNIIPLHIANDLFRKYQLGRIYDFEIDNVKMLEIYVMDDLNNAITRLREIHDLESKDFIINEGHKLMHEKNALLLSLCKEYIE